MEVWDVIARLLGIFGHMALILVAIFALIAGVVVVGFLMLRRMT